MEDRIAQFENMVASDPDNELGHFSLGKAYLESGRHGEAVRSLKRVLEINPGYSKAYLLLAKAQEGSGDRAGAADTLTRGYRIANDRGDLQPRNEMGQMLEDMGMTPPQAAPPQPAVSAASAPGEWSCTRCGRSGPRLTERPFRGETGERVLQEICQPCWREWLGMGIKVINELRLDLNTKAGAAAYDQYMKEFLGL